MEVKITPVRRNAPVWHVDWDGSSDDVYDDGNGEDAYYAFKDIAEKHFSSKEECQSKIDSTIRKFPELRKMNLRPEKGL